jgi:hypothetical protein
MRQIRKGLEQSLDVSLFADPRLEAYQMREIRQDLEQNKTL